MAIPGLPRPTFHRRVLSLRISVTDRCQLRCVYCRPSVGQGRHRRSTPLTQGEILRFVRQVQARYGLEKIRLTGGEALLRPDLCELIAALRELGVADVGLTTNGHALATQVDRLWRAGLRRLNISLDSLNPKTYATLTRGGRLADTLAGIEAALARGFRPLKVNAVVLRDHNLAEVPDLAAWAIEKGISLRFLELMPIGHVGDWFRAQYVPEAQIRARLEQGFDLAPILEQATGTSREYSAADREGRSGRLGFISSQSHPFCGSCCRLRLDSRGRLVPCLASGLALPVRHLLADPSAEAGEALEHQIAMALLQKRPDFGVSRPDAMVTIGG